MAQLEPFRNLGQVTRALGYHLGLHMAVCPDCEADIEIDEFDVDKGEIISCPECGVELEVVGLAPLELAPATPDEDDWE